MIKYHYPIIFNSSEASGAINKTDNGAAFAVSLERPILIPKEAVYCWIVCQEAEIWNTSPNIIEGVNDTMYVSDLGGDYTIVVPEGLYDIPLLNAEINRQVQEAGRPNNEIVIFGNAATQKTIIQILTIGTSIDFNPSDTFRDILGFDPQVIENTGPDPNALFDADNIANFNQVDYYIIHTDLITHGIPTNNKKSQAVAQVLIEAPPGSQILHQPDNPPEIPANELIGNKKNLINCWLTNQDDVRISTAGEEWSFRLVLYYIVPTSYNEAHGIHR